ncbi:hypothetical protein D3C73_1446580 [compost metagenome]
MVIFTSIKDSTNKTTITIVNNNPNNSKTLAKYSILFLTTKNTAINIVRTKKSIGENTSIVDTYLSAKYLTYIDISINIQTI